MSPVAPLDELSGFARPIEPRAEFADALLAACLAELAPAPRRRGWRRAPVLIALAVLALVVVAVATATYLALRASSTGPTGPPAELTVMRVTGGAIGPKTLARISVVNAKGRLQTLWQCPNRTWCGELTSMDWSRNGRYLALTLDELGGRSGFVGLHVVDLDTGNDTQVGAPKIAHLEREQPSPVLRRVGAAVTRVLGCLLPHQVVWSPDATRLAYICGDSFLGGNARTSLFVVRRDGSGRRRVATRTLSAYWPSWSPDGRSLAFAVQPLPSSPIYTIRVDGTARKLLVAAGSAPVWSPDGKTIAYAATCGVRFVGADGEASSDRGCLGVRPSPRPAWSPDGSQLAIGTSRGVELFRPGQSMRRITSTTSAGSYGVGRPAWAPATAVERLLARRHPSTL